jgi:hypothetical protein
VLTSSFAHLFYKKIQDIMFMQRYVQALTLLTLSLVGCGEEVSFQIPGQSKKVDPAQQIREAHQEKLVAAGEGEVSEVGKAAAQAIRENQEKDLVKQAGEAAVILQLARKQYADLKERLVRVKTLKTGFERDLKTTQAKVDEARKAGKTEIADMYSQKMDQRQRMVAFMTEREPLAEKALKDYSVEYEKIKVEVELLQDDVAAYNTATGILDASGPSNPLRQRLDTISELKQALTKHADRAKSLFDVSEIEDKFKL